MNIKSKHRFFSRFIRILCLLLGVICFTFCLLIEISILQGFELGIIIAFLLIAPLAIAALALGITSFKSITFNKYQRTLSLHYFGLRRKTWTDENIIGYKIFSNWTKIGMVEKVLIVSSAKDQIWFTDADTKNYSELKELVSSMYSINDRLEHNDWSMFKLSIISFLAMVLLTAIIMILK